MKKQFVAIMIAATTIFGATAHAEAASSETMHTLQTLMQEIETNQNLSVQAKKEAKYSVEYMIELERRYQSDMPEGLARVLDILQDSITNPKTGQN